MRAPRRLDRLGGRFTKIARVFSREYGVNVVLTGTACCTDGSSTIMIPANADHLSDADQRVLEGMLDHEWSHVWQEREAREAKERWASTGGRGPAPITPEEAMRACPDARHRLMLNVVEDVRIEREAAARYPGVEEHLEVLHAFTAERAASGVASPADFWHSVGVAIIYRCKGDEEGLRAWAHPDIVRILDEVIPEEVEACRHTTRIEDCVEVAYRIISKLEDACEAPDGDTGEDEGDNEEGDEKSPVVIVVIGGPAGETGDESGDEGDETGDDGSMVVAVAAGADEEEDAGDGDSDVEDGEGKPEDGEKPATVIVILSPELAEVVRSSEDVHDSLTEIVREHIAEAAEEDAVANKRYIPCPSALMGDRWITPNMGSMEAYNVIKAEVAPVTSALRSKIAAALMIKSQRRIVGDKERGGLDAAALYRVKGGDRRVFCARTEEFNIDTAIEILVDLSGSMVGENVEYARLTCVALGEALSSVGIPFEIIGFDNEDRMKSDFVRGVHSRWGSFRYRRFKLFNDPWRSARRRIVNMNSGYQNVDGEAVMTAARRLSQRPESRQILIVFSDGEPAGACTVEHNDNNLHKVIKTITSSGIEVVGLGIDDESVKRFYSRKNGAHSVVFHNLAQMAPGVLRILRAKLLSTGRSAA